MSSVDENQVQITDFKSRLIEWGQKYKVEVVFEVTDSSYDEQNNPIFESRVIVGGMDLGSGKGYSKKESHQKAAKKAIKKLRNDNELLEKLLVLNKNASAETAAPTEENLAVENVSE